MKRIDYNGLKISFFKRPIYVALGLFAVLCLIAPLLANGQQTTSAAPVFPKGTLTIRRSDGREIPFKIEIATTPEQEAYGLMFRKSLPVDAGMLFIDTPDRVMMMWMKNTYIPLDMLFVRKDGTIAKIITHAAPLDLSILSSDEPVHGVIEINAGEAQRQGLQTGDRVLYPAFQ